MKISTQGIQVSACTPRVKEGQLAICVVKVSAQSVADALAQYGSKLTEFRSKFAQSLQAFPRRIKHWACPDRRLLEGRFSV